jgi:hypothetical protein
MERGTGANKSKNTKDGAQQRSKICAICHCLSENYHLNYNVNTCNSCRAFFRRSVQSSTFLNSDGKFVSNMCITGGHCTITAATRKSCRWCRFTACRTAGMAEKNVLGEKEKAHKFRLAIKRRQAPQTQIGLREGFATMTFGKHSKLSRDSDRERHKDELKQEVETDTSSAENTTSSIEEMKHDQGTTRNEKSSVSSVEQIIPSSQEEVHVQETIYKDYHNCFSVDTIKPETHQMEAREQPMPIRPVHNMAKSVLIYKHRTQTRTNDYLDQKYVDLEEKTVVNKTICDQRTVSVDTMYAAVESLQMPDNNSCKMDREVKTHRCKKIRDQMSVKQKHVQQTWAITLNATMPKAEFVHALVAMHLGHPELFTKDLLQNHIETLKNIFQNYALQQPEFVCLSTNEQKRLVKKNCPTFVLYMLAGYISANDGLTQLSWLLANKVPHNVRKLRPMAVAPCDLNVVLDLFSETRMEQFTNVIKDARWWNMEDGYFFALACLFNDSCTQDIYKYFLILSEWAHDVYWIKSSPDNIRDILRVLENAQKFINDHSGKQDANDTYSPLRRKEVSFGFTHQEELVMTSLIAKAEQAYGNLPLGDYIAKCMYDFAVGIPFPPEYAPIANANATERLHHVLFSMSEDFSNLSFSDKTRAMTVNTNHAMAVYMAKISACETVEEQIGHYVRVGALPEVSHPKTKNKKYTVVDATDKDYVAVNTENMQRIGYLLGELKELVTDNGMYQLLLLVLLTNGLVNSDGLNMQDQYLSLFRKRMMSLSDGDLVDTFYRCIGNVKEVGDLTAAYFETN